MLHYKDAPFAVKASLESSHFSLDRRLENGVWKNTLTNRAQEPAALEEIVLYRGRHGFPVDTPIYGEGYQMLSQYEGTLADARCITSLSDAGHYRFAQKEGFFTVYNLLIIYSAPEAHMAAFASCRRFSGLIRFNADLIELALNLEGVCIQPGEALALEDVYMAAGSPEALFDKLSEALTESHPRLPLNEAAPSGWCSWYCFGPDVTAKNITDNMNRMREHLPEFRYVQIDDGYEAHMGDWLIPNPDFGDVIKTIQSIHDAGLEPAIWVAPFIAEADSQLFLTHPDWFVKDAQGKPLSSAEVSFGGWRNGPWYMLDGSHPEARAYFIRVFKTFRDEYGIRYFKLDANTWGCMPFGEHYIENITAVEAYRMGMEAVIAGAGEGAVILGCNAPMWPSIGVVNCMRVSNDLSREWNWSRVQTRECLNRNWQHGVLWLNDPDVVTLMNTTKKQLGGDGEWIDVPTTKLTEAELRYHRTALFATGGMMLCGDDMTQYDEAHFALMRKMRPQKAVRFSDHGKRSGAVEVDGRSYLFFFNDSDAPRRFTADAAVPLKDYWTDEPVSHEGGTLEVLVPPHDAMLLISDPR